MKKRGQTGEGIVLAIFKGCFGVTFQLDTNGKIVAILTSFPEAFTGMPSTFKDGDILGHIALAIDDKVGRDFECGNFLEGGVILTIQLPQEEIIDITTTKRTGGETDGMKNQQVDGVSLRPSVAVG